MVVEAAEELIKSAHAVQGVAARMVAGEDPAMLIFIWASELEVFERVTDDLTLTSGASISLNMTPYERLIALNKIVLDDFVERARKHM
ncbi:hypothetical protein ACZ90_00260 [Streptomyces albus subsp. albus]|nr:hypothetical protein ACZ90_00260 [Streptomyces albus subsp. albus]